MSEKPSIFKLLDKHMWTLNRELQEFDKDNGTETKFEWTIQRPLVELPYQEGDHGIKWEQTGERKFSMQLSSKPKEKAVELV